MNPGEMVIKSSNEIGYGGGLSRQNNELILTNQSLILVHKNLFGKTKEVLLWPALKGKPFNARTVTAMLPSEAGMKQYITGSAVVRRSAQDNEKCGGKARKSISTMGDA